MRENEKFDVFIAYYGNKTSGSESQALGLYKYIEGKEIYPGKNIKAYFHPVTNPYGRFEDTPLIVARTPMFLLVTDKNIQRTVDGQLIRHREDGSLSNIYEEVRTFHDSPMYKSHGGDIAAKLFITDDFNFKDAECLHPIFSGRTALNSKEAVVDWITYFYQNAYIERLYNHCKYLAKNQNKIFRKGDWVAEVEGIWNCIYDEKLGRTLMIYYIMKAEDGDELARNRLRVMYKKYRSKANLDPSTQDILSRIQRQGDRYGIF